MQLEDDDIPGAQESYKEAIQAWHGCIDAHMGLANTWLLPEMEWRNKCDPFLCADIHSLTLA